VTLQIAGLGYLIGGSILVSDATAYYSASTKFNFWRHCNKSAVVFDSIKANTVWVQLNSFSNWTINDNFKYRPFYYNGMIFLYPLRGGREGHIAHLEALE
jgi:hypothetical protein